MKVEVDISDWQSRMGKYELVFLRALETALGEAADELLRVSAFEVPLDTGFLMNTGHSTIAYSISGRLPEGVVSYDTVYAHRLHEHPEYRFQNGRKGKYLEDPAKRNLAKWNNIISGIISSELSRA